MIYECPNCGEKENLHYNYDLTKQHRPVTTVVCNRCAWFFDGNISIIELTEKIKDQMIYETPDKGKTIYERKVGDTTTRYELKHKYTKGKGYSAYLEEQPQQDITAKSKAQELYTRAYSRWCFELSHEKNYITAKDIAINICNEVLGYMGADRGTEWWSSVREILKVSNHKDLYNPENSGLKQ